MPPTKLTSRKIAELQCDICLRMRPMELVDDLVADVSDAVGFGPSYVGVVVSFCLDSDKCRLKAERRVERFREWLTAMHKECRLAKS